MRLPTSLAVRVGAVCAAVAIAAGGGVAAADSALAAPAHVKVPTALSISNTTPVLHRHKTTAVIEGQLTGPDNSTIAGKRIVLQRQGPDGHWRVTQFGWTHRIGRTRGNGWVRFHVYIGKKAATFRLVFRGTRNFARSVSATDTISPVSAS